MPLNKENIRKDMVYVFLVICGVILLWALMYFEVDGEPIAFIVIAYVLLIAMGCVVLYLIWLVFKEIYDRYWITK